jgi:hypothetical protein
LFFGSVDFLEMWPRTDEKQIPHPAKNAGIPFDFAQGRRDDKWRVNRGSQPSLFFHLNCALFGG